MLWQCLACTMTIRNHFEATIKFLYIDYEDIFLMCTDKLCTISLQTCIKKKNKVNFDFIVTTHTTDDKM